VRNKTFFFTYLKNADKNKIHETYGYVYTHAVIRESLVNVSPKKNLILSIKKRSEFIACMDFFHHMHYNSKHYTSGEESVPVFRLAADGEQSSP
jgi:hypothetical protein